MDIRFVGAVLRKRALTIFLCVLLGLGGAVMVTAATTRIYSASARVYVSFAAERAANTLGGGSMITQRFADYALMAGTPTVMGPVVTSLQLPTTPQGLASSISVTNPPGSTSLVVTATATDADRSALLANEVAKQLGRSIEALETPAGAKSSLLQVTLVDPAVPPGQPSSPQVDKNLAVGLILGLVIGVGTAFLRDSLDNRLKTPWEIERLTGSSPIGVVGYDADAKVHPIIQSGQPSPRTEAFRRLRTNLQYVDVDNPPKVISVTSAFPAEGKSTTAANLALALALNGFKVVLIEADLRNPKVAAYFDVASSAGLSEVLSGQSTWQEAIVPWNRGLLSLLLEGSIPPNPTEMLASQQMTNLLSKLSEAFDYIILDTPPLMLVSDGAVISSQGDGALVVIRYNKTTRDMVSEAIAELERVDARVLGTVLTFDPGRKRGRYRLGYYGYGYGYGYGYRNRYRHGKGGDRGYVYEVDSESVSAAPDVVRVEGPAKP